ncbi:clasp N terminal-domain-containing protein [Phlyctochytrium arcticum]|nr:clasp N terminal-domain-containing protein [Phlyctochytrium arcticum]
MSGQLKRIVLSDDNSLDHELRSLVSKFEDERETEENWTARENALLRFGAVTRGSSSLPSFVPLCKAKLKGVFHAALVTERTRLARTTMLVIQDMAGVLGDRFEPLVDMTLPHVLKLATRANKVFVQTAKQTMLKCIEEAGVPSIIPLLVEGHRNPSKTLREVSAECLVCLLEDLPAARLQPFAEAVETAVSVAAVDPLSNVRDFAKRGFESYKRVYPHRAEKFVGGLSDVSKKNLKLDGVRSRPSSVRKSVVQKDRPRGPLNQAVDDDGSMNSLGPSSDMGASASSLISATGPLRRPVLVKPTRVQVSASDLIEHKPKTGRQTTHLTESLGGAQRVPRDETSAESTPAAAATALRTKISTRALRVPMNAGGSQSGLSGNTSPHSSTTAPEPQQKPMADKRRSILGSSTASITGSTSTLGGGRDSVAARSRSARSSLGGKEQPVMDVASFRRNLLSPDWAVRVAAFDGLSQKLAGTMVNDRRLAAILQSCVGGIDDPHFKVIQAALNAMRSLLAASPNVEPEILESTLPRVCAVFFSPQHKNKHALREAAGELLEQCRKRFGPDSILGALMQAMNTPEHTKTGRTRWLVAYLHMWGPADDWGGFLTKTAHVRSMLARMASIAHESTDITLLRDVAGVLETVFEVNPEGYVAALDAMKVLDQNTLEKIFSAPRSGMASPTPSGSHSPSPSGSRRGSSPSVSRRLSAVSRVRSPRSSQNLRSYTTSTASSRPETPTRTSFPAGSLVSSGITSPTPSSPSSSPPLPPTFSPPPRRMSPPVERPSRLPSPGPPRGDRSRSVSRSSSPLASPRALPSASPASADYASAQPSPLRSRSSSRLPSPSKRLSVSSISSLASVQSTAKPSAPSPIPASSLAQEQETPTETTPHLKSMSSSASSIMTVKSRSFVRSVMDMADGPYVETPSAQPAGHPGQHHALENVYALNAGVQVDTQSAVEEILRAEEFITGSATASDDLQIGEIVEVGRRIESALETFLERISAHDAWIASLAGLSQWRAPRSCFELMTRAFGKGVMVPPEECSVVAGYLAKVLSFFTSLFWGLANAI